MTVSQEVLDVWRYQCEERIRRWSQNKATPEWHLDVSETLALLDLVRELRGDLESARVVAEVIENDRDDLRNENRKLRSRNGWAPEFEIHGGAPCCHEPCKGTWGANCPHCHQLDHECPHLKARNLKWGGVRTMEQLVADQVRDETAVSTQARQCENCDSHEKVFWNGSIWTCEDCSGGRYDEVKR